MLYNIFFHYLIRDEIYSIFGLMESIFNRDDEGNTLDII